MRAACVMGVVGASAQGPAGAGHLVSPATESTSALPLNEVDTLEGSEQGDMTWLVSSQRYFGTYGGQGGGRDASWTSAGLDSRDAMAGSGQALDVGRTESLWDLRPG